VALRFASATTVAALVFAGGCSEPIQKPVREGLMFVDGERVPPTPAEMLRDADGVIVARYTGKSRLIDKGATGDFSTNYTFEITETLKPNRLLPTAGAPVDINLPGGDKEFATYVERIRVAHTEPLYSSHTYVVFLSRNTVRPELYVSWNMRSLFDITGGVVKPIDLEDRRQEGLSAGVFLEALRKAR